MTRDFPAPHPDESLLGWHIRYLHAGAPKKKRNFERPFCTLNNTRNRPPEVVKDTADGFNRMDSSREGLICLESQDF